VNDDATKPSLAAVVTVLQGQSRGETFHVQKFPAVLGRGDDADVRLLDDPRDGTLSRRHARLSIAAGRLRIQDLSTNGTTVAGRMLSVEEQCSLADCEEIWLGPSTLLRVETLRSGPAPSQPVPQAAPARTAAMSLRIQALGAFRATLGGQAVPDTAWETRKPILLLAYLAYQGGRPVSAERACSDLWPDHEQGGRQALQSTLARLRRALRRGDVRDPVLFERGAYRLDPSFELDFDVARLLVAAQKGDLESLREVESLYQGPFLEGYSDDWACVRRLEIEQQYHQAIGHLAALLQEREECQEAIRLYRLVLCQEPCWEQGHQGILKAFVQAGQRDEAIRHYHRYAETMRVQLGLAPSPEMLRLYYTLLNPC
jgi:DNA-binding SARP family transcriptional activator